MSRNFLALVLLFWFGTVRRSEPAAPNEFAVPA